MTRAAAIAGAILGLMLAFSIALALTACAPDRAYFNTDQRQATADAVDLDPDVMMDAVCVVKSRRPMTQEWRSYCSRRGIRGT